MHNQSMVELKSQAAVYVILDLETDFVYVVSRTYL